MKLLLVQSTIYVPTHGGENKANRLLIEGLAKRGHSCRVVVPACGAQGPGTRSQFLSELAARGLSVVSSSNGVDVFYQEGVEVHAVNDPSQVRLHLANQIREFDPTWTLVSSEDPGQVLLEAALEASPSRVVYIAHTMLFFPFGSNCFLVNQSKTALFRKLAGIITVSNYLKDYIRQGSGCESVVIPFPVYGSGPFPHFGGFDDGFVTMINPCAYKGISIFLELARRMPNVQFAAVPSWGTTNEDRAALGQLPNVRLLKATDGIDEIFAQTRVLLVPSLWGEGFPLVPVEAMLRGIPVIASNSSGLPESKLGVDYVLPVRMIEHYEQRFDDRKLPIPVIPEQDVDPWAKTVGKLVSDRDLYNRLSTTSRNVALAYASSLGVGPFEDFLKNLAPRSELSGSMSNMKEKDSQTDMLLKNMDNLSPERRALLSLRLRKKREGDPKKLTIPQREKAESFPLSFAQERLWFLDQMEPGNSAYNLLDDFRLTGPLDLSALEHSLDEIVRRHEILRTTFPTVDGRPVQVIAPPKGLRLTVIDLHELPEPLRKKETQQLIIDEARRPFDLARGPLLRSTLLRLDHEEHILLLTAHHIISDGWSAGVLFRELTALYVTFSNGRSSPLTELPIQYADFAVWQRQWLQSDFLDKHLSYWRQQLKGAAPVLELPTDRPRPAVQTIRGACQSLTLPKSLSENIKTLSQQEGVTLFMTLLAAFQTLLARYTQQTDIVVGSPIAGRNRAETEALIGFFVNTLVMRTDLSGDPTFRELLGRVREVALGAYVHQDLPFEKLVEELQPERSLSHPPLFQVMFALQNARKETLELSGLTLKTLKVDNETSKFDLMLSISEGTEGLTADLEYNIDLFDAATMRRMLGHWQNLLTGIAADPEHRLSELPLLSAAENEQLLVQWNGTQEEYPRDKTIHELFQTQVENSPEQVAVVFAGEQLTYAELNSRANQLGHYLRKLGVRPDVRVGICMERSLGMMVGLLGILKAGGTYIPLDPTYPHERLSFMLKDADMPVLVTQRGLQKIFPGCRAEQVCLDEDWETIAQESTYNLESGATAENLVYIIYTSGSTGKPKGVGLSHRSLSNLLSWQLNKSASSSSAKTLQFASLSFDVSFQEIFSTWCAGGTLVLISEELRRDARGLLRLLIDKAITRLFLPFIALQQLAEVASREGLLPITLREIITAGEQLQITQPIASLFSELPGCALHNQYGPSESHVVTAFALNGSSSDWAALPPIGQPINNTQIYLLDQHSNPVPIGVPGELHIGGVCLSPGYLNRPELTAERFIPNPFSEEPGARLYKTGDLARYLPDGNIEFLGRIDHQVKIRGYRVELGEIEAVLVEHEGVRETVVKAREDVVGEKRLVAYLVTAQNPAPTVSDLRSFLSEKLPDFMVPSAFVILDELPLTPSGKVDRRALPAPDHSRPELGVYEPPRTAVEEVVAGVWANVLGLEQVGIRDNFFDLGGHSLKATQVTSRLRETFQVELPVRSLFESPTVAGLADKIETMSGSAHILKIAKVLLRLNQLSEDEAKMMLAERSARRLEVIEEQW